MGRIVIRRKNIANYEFWLNKAFSWVRMVKMRGEIAKSKNGLKKIMAVTYTQ